MTGDTKTGKESDVRNIRIRENLVETAVNFLLNPSVKNKPDNTKTAFLKNKGLTDEEISAAFQIARSNPEFSSARQQPVEEKSLTPHSLAYYPRPISFWAKLSSVSSSLIVIAVALYGLHRFYKLYIEPWLFGTKPKSDELKELVTELSSSVTELKHSVSTLEFTVNSQKEQIDKVFLSEGTPYMPIPMAVADLKTEVGNLKSLLINRHQFPAVPKVASNLSIPQWQLSDTDAKDTDKESKSDKVLTDESLPSDEETVEWSHSKEETEHVLDTIEKMVKSTNDLNPAENGVSDVHNSDVPQHNGDVPQDTSVINEEGKNIALKISN